MINTFIRPQYALLAPLLDIMGKTNISIIERGFRKITKRILQVRSKVESKVIDHINGNVIDFMKNAYDRIKLKKSRRFDKPTGLLYNSNYMKVSSKLIPDNLMELMKYLGEKTIKAIGILVEQLV